MRQPPVPLAFPMEPEGSSHSRGPAVDPAGLRGRARAGTPADRWRGWASRPGRRCPRRSRSPTSWRGALRDEIETAEIAALWLTDEPDLDLRLGLARQVGDEARHFEMIGRPHPGAGQRPDGRPADPRPQPGLPLPPRAPDAGRAARRRAGAGGGGAAAERAARPGLRGAGRRRDGPALPRRTSGPTRCGTSTSAGSELPRYALTAADQEAARRAVARTLQLAEEATDPSRTAKALAGAARPTRPCRRALCDLPGGDPWSASTRRPPTSPRRRRPGRARSAR